MNENDDLKNPENEALKADLASQTERANTFEAKLKEHLLDAGLERAAVRGRAFNPAQVVSLLKPNAELIQATDQDGRPIDGQFELMVRTESGGTLGVHEAVDHLRSTDVNLFFTASDLRTGEETLDGESNFQRMARLARTDSKKYREIRQKHPEYLGLRPRRRK